MRSNQTLSHYLRVPILGIAALCLVAASGCTNKEREAGQLGALAQQQLDQGQVGAAQATIAKAVAARDDIVDLQLLRGRIEYAAQANPTAFAAYSNALAIDPSNVEALQGVSMLGYQLGERAAAEQAADQLLTLDPRSLEGLLVKGLLALGKRDFKDVFSYADQILAISPGNEGGIILKARALYESGDKPGAAQLVERAAKDIGNTANLARIRLEIARGRGDSPEMLAQFERLRREPKPDLALAIDEINTRYKLGDHGRARDLFLSVLAREPLDQATANRVLGVWREYDAVDLSAGEIRTIAAKASPAAREELARFALAAGRPQLATAVVAGLDTSAAEGLRARILSLAGSPRAAQALADKVLGRDHTQCDALLARSALALRAADTPAAVAAGQQAAAECPGYEDAWLATAAAFDRARQPRQTDRVYADAMQHNPQSSRVARAYAGWLVAAGQADKAILVAQRLARSAPALVSGWQLYRELCAGQRASCPAAAAGLSRARARLALDRLPGERAPQGLLTGFND